MRMRRRKRSNTEAAVMMSPLIDCVFLLLIFFLATSMIKRWERQIPVTLADPTASVSKQVQADTYALGLSQDGSVHRESGRTESGVMRFERVEQVSPMLITLITERGANAPVELVVEQYTPFQTVINVLDMLQHHGLSHVRTRMRDGKL